MSQTDPREKILVTGAAGFIGMHVCQKFLDLGYAVTGIDNLNSYYDVTLKKARVDILSERDGFRFEHTEIADAQAVKQVFGTSKPDYVVHLAAQAGVRYSIDHPQPYIDSNIQGFHNMLENCRHFGVRHLAYASSSSVYGSNASMPFRETDNVDHPLALYGATKKANELMAHSYSNLFDLPTTGLRFFTVYGPWGRPDMALFLFTRAILAGEPINVFNEGRMVRDFTYIDDIAEGVARVTLKPATPCQDFDPSAPNPSVSSAPYRIFNIGNGQPVELLAYIGALEDALGMTAQKNMLPLQDGDLAATLADCSALDAWVGFKPATPIGEGVQAFVDWYRSFIMRADTSKILYLAAARVLNGAFPSHSFCAVQLLHTSRIWTIRSYLFRLCHCFHLLFFLAGSLSVQIFRCKPNASLVVATHRSERLHNGLYCSSFGAVRACAHLCRCNYYCARSGCAGRIFGGAGVSGRASILSAIFFDFRFALRSCGGFDFICAKYLRDPMAVMVAIIFQGGAGCNYVWFHGAGATVLRVERMKRIDTTEIASVLRYSAPCSNYLTLAVINVADRLVIGHVLDLKSVGLYIGAQDLTMQIIGAFAGVLLLRTAAPSMRAFDGQGITRVTARAFLQRMALAGGGFMGLIGVCLALAPQTYFLLLAPEAQHEARNFYVLLTRWRGVFPD